MDTRASRRKYHVIYKTTCTVTDKYYIGIHSTDNLNDGYKGSGKHLWRSIRKHGKENHITEILEHQPDRKSLIDREIEIVTKEVIDDPMCMNIALGGSVGGGWLFVPVEIRIAARKKAGERIKLLKLNPVWSKNHAEKMSVALRKVFSEREIKPHGFIGMKHSAESIKKMKTAKVDFGKGEANSQFGTCWVCLDKPTKIKKEELDSYLKLGYRRGRK